MFHARSAGGKHEIRSSFEQGGNSLSDGPKGNIDAKCIISCGRDGESIPSEKTRAPAVGTSGDSAYSPYISGRVKNEMSQGGRG